jgi:hypothetical protein
MARERKDEQGPVISQREAASRLGISTWHVNKMLHRELEVVEQHGVNLAGERFVRELVTVASVDREIARREAAKATRAAEQAA